ncbi:hypothetical protein LIG30_2060 [Burkholderia sp. lig30]|nr:hypothetical protein LIG30_2060 [Burkholderia sp. lig30]
MQAGKGEIQKCPHSFGLSSPVSVVKMQPDVSAHMLDENRHQSSSPDMGCRREIRKLSYNLAGENGLQFEFTVVGRERRGHLPVFELAIHAQVPGCYLASDRMAEHTTPVCRQLIESRWCSVQVEISRRCTHDHLDRKELPTDYPLTGRHPDPEASIDTIEHPVADAIIELDIWLNTRVLATELVEQRHEDIVSSTPLRPIRMRRPPGAASSVAGFRATSFLSRANCGLRMLATNAPAWPSTSR